MTDFAFTPDVVAGVSKHMNDDHLADNLLIVRANGAPEATSTLLTDLRPEGLVFTVTEPAGERDLLIGWTRPITERADIRHAVVDLFKAAGGARAAREQH